MNQTAVDEAVEQSPTNHSVARSSVPGQMLCQVSLHKTLNGGAVNNNFPMVSIKYMKT